MTGRCDRCGHGDTATYTWAVDDRWLNVRRLCRSCAQRAANALRDALRPVGDGAS